MKVNGNEIRVGDRIDIGGLGVYPLTASTGTATAMVDLAYLTGPEAFERGLIEVSELDPPEVPSLLVTNRADVPILLVEGEMLIGGDQNRTMNVTVLCPPMSVTIVPVCCVEAGRWGARREISASNRHAPGSLRSVKTANLESMAGPGPDRRSDQGRVWEEVERQSVSHQVASGTASLDDVQETFEARIAERLDQIAPGPDQIGVMCTVGDRVVGLDLFDRPSSLARYLRGIVGGHALDAAVPTPGPDPLQAIERFFAQVETAGREKRDGVGLGDELLLRGAVSGVGLSVKNRLVHLAAYPTPA